MKLQHKLFVPLLLIVTLPILAMGIGAYTYILKITTQAPINDLESVNTLAMNTALGVCGIILVIFVLSVAYIQRLLLNPIFAIKNLVKNITDGVSDAPIELLSKNDELGELTDSIITMRSKINENNKRIETLAYFDELTQLPNRYSFQQQLDELIAHAGFYYSKFAVLFLDLDNFKAVNDTVGHDIGDKLLIQASKRIQQCFNIKNSKNWPNGDIQQAMLARLGGDEFTLLLPNVNKPDKLEPLFEDLIRHLSQPFFIDGHEILVGASVGIAIYPANGKQRKELLKNADIAMYESKKAGKNCFTFFSTEMKEKANERQFIEAALAKALRNHEFRLEYQPRIKLKEHSVDGFEALIRWNNAEIGNIPPDKFIPIAESNLQILEIGRWVLTEACSKIRDWINQGFSDFVVSINVSSVQLYRANLVEEIEIALATNDIPGHYLEIEITETAILEEQALVITKLKRIKELGVRISLDDFGTGYSSLSHLHALPIDILKIDRSFICDIASSQYSADVFEGIIQLAKRLRLITVAEGVEKSAQHEVLLLSKCDHAQGYYYAKPLSEDLADKYVKDELTKQKLVSL